MRRGVVATAVSATLVVALAASYSVLPGSVVSPQVSGVLAGSSVAPTDPVLVPASDALGAWRLPQTAVSDLLVEEVRPEPDRGKPVVRAEVRARGGLLGETDTGPRGDGGPAPREGQLLPTGAALVALSSPPERRRTDHRIVVRDKGAEVDIAASSRTRRGLTRTATVVASRTGRPATAARSVETLAGNLCPDPEGEIVLDLDLAVQVGRGDTPPLRSLSADVRAQLDDAARLTDVTAALRAGWSAGEDLVTVGGELSLDAVELGPVTAAEEPAYADETAERLGVAGLADARALAMGAVAAAQQLWSTGGCVDLTARAPQVVRPGSRTRVPLRIVSGVDGERLPAKVAIEVDGPGRVVEAGPRGFTFVAPRRRAQETTVVVTAASDRGRARLPVTISTTPEDLRVSGDYATGSAVGVKCAGPQGRWTVDLLSSSGTAAGELVFRLGEDRRGDFRGERSFDSPVGTLTVAEAGSVEYLPGKGRLVLRDSEGGRHELDVSTGTFCGGGR